MSSSLVAPTVRVNYRVTFTVLAVGTLAYALLQSLVSPVLPLFETSLHTSQNTVTWVLTAYLLSASVCTPILGRIGDIVGKKKVLVAVLIALAVGSILAALATSITLMIIARVIQGIGGGLIPISFGIIRDEFPRAKVAGAVGSIAALLGFGGGLGVVLAGPIVNAFNYHYLFWIPGVIVIIAAIATLFFVPESSERTPGKISWSAAILLSAWLVALLVAVSEAPVWGWGSLSVIGLIVASVVLAVLWATVELHAKQPLIDMRMMRIPAVWTTNLVAFLFGVGMYSVFAFVPEFLQTPSSAGYGFTSDITDSGLILAPLCIAMFIFGTVSGRLSGRFGAKTILISGSVIAIPGYLVLAFAHGAIWEILIATALLGIGIGLAFSAMSAIVVDAVPSHQTGVASGMNANIRTIGGSIGAAVMTSVVTADKLPTGLPKESGYTAGFGVLAAATIVAALAGLLIPKLKTARDEHQREQAGLAHAELAIVAGGTIVGDESE
jgi:EmrB/QacA subfamily drug resistance transporter